VQQNLADFAERLRNASSNEELESVLLDELSKHGFTQFVYAFHTSRPDLKSQYININNLDVDWINHYTETGLFKQDWFLDYSIGHSDPVFWADVYKAADNGKIDDQYHASLYRAADFGVSNGVTVPIKTKPGLLAGMSLVSDATLPTEELRRELNANQSHILACVDLFHTFVDRGELSIENLRITPRQHKTLKWLSEGLTQDAIASKLNVHVSRVQAHILGAKKRLSAATPNQAIAKAVRLGII